MQAKVHGIREAPDRQLLDMMRTIWSRLIYGAFYAMLYDKVWRHRMPYVATAVQAGSNLC